MFTKNALQIYYKNLEYTRILCKKSNLFEVFCGKALLFAQASERKFGGSPLAGGPKLQQIFVYFFLTCARKRTFLWSIFL